MEQWRYHRDHGDINVYAGDGRIIGRDPEASVRWQLRNEYYYLRNTH